MKIKTNIKTPTGNICSAIGAKGKALEFLSIGDYGKEKNLKADFMGLTKEINGVEHTDLLPLEDKWVITISTQYGCSMNCKFCDAPKVGPGINATFHDLINQVKLGLSLHPEVKSTKRLNLHYARMGEPTYNDMIIPATYYLKAHFKYLNSHFHPVISTMMPKHNIDLKRFLIDWMRYKNIDGDAGLQLSINTTDENIRKDLMPHTMTLKEISKMMKEVLKVSGNPEGRKITLNFALTENEVDGKILSELFDPKYYICKLTPMHMTTACKDRGLETKDGYTAFAPYKDVEENLKANGFDVIVFVPSKEEDESRITCGNVILSDKSLVL